VSYLTEIKFLAGEPACLVGSSLVLADVHLGYEKERIRGSKVSFTGKITGHVERLLKQTGASEIIFLGDVKHNLRRAGAEEKHELKSFFYQLAQKARVVVVKGNHDGGIEEMAPVNVEIANATGYRVGDVALVHGHAWPSEQVLEGARSIVIGHNHPAVQFVDRLGHRSVLPCWAIGRFDERARPKIPNYGRMKVVLAPAFNPLITGSPLNAPGRRLIGMLKQGIFKLDDAKVYLLNGICVGTVRSLNSLKT